MCLLSAAAGLAPAWNLTPVPARIVAGTGELRFDENFRVALTGHREPRLEFAATRLIENLVRRLRTKIELDPNAPQLLITMRGLGYKLVRVMEE